ncbi:MAG: NAD(P)-binding domain-containing protein [Hyphomicrobiaceae bacterium]
MSRIVQAGIIGTGHLAGFLVQGCRRTGAPYRFLVSPRGKAKSEALHQRYGVDVALSNQEVVDGSDLVIACVRPKDARSTLEPLTFRDGQTVLSLMAGVSLADLRAYTRPAAAVVGMMNGHANALGFGASIVHPANDAAIAFLANFGTLHVFDDGARYAAASVMAGVSGTSFGLLIELIRWHEAAGLDPLTARRLVTETVIGSAEVLRGSTEPLDDLLAGLQTPGGITEEGNQRLRERGVFTAFHEMLDAIGRRMGANG